VRVVVRLADAIDAIAEADGLGGIEEKAKIEAGAGLHVLGNPSTTKDDLSIRKNAGGG
jgi:hypothetical protein